MRAIHPFSVYPSIPLRLRGLWELAYNLRWTWDSDTMDLFRRLDIDLWRTHRNPVLLLQLVAQERLEWAAEDEGLLAHYDRVLENLRTYTSEPGWFRHKHPDAKLDTAYFCMEFGVTECLPIYSGGLGVLAGDHLKTASDLDVPLVAIGLLYHEGYFSQYLNADGWQLERYPVNDHSSQPVTPVQSSDGSLLTITLRLAERDVIVQVWLALVGRIPLYLLDTNVLGNHPADQDITAALYGGGTEDRLRQEMVLGIGGIRALRALGMDPLVCHMNEGHSAFLALERIRLLMEEKALTYSQARQATAAGTIFTTHTPVPAGFDLFPPDLMRKYFGSYVSALGLTWEAFLSMGRIDPGNQAEPYNVAVLAMRQAPHRNAVSKLHQRVTRGMMKASWPEFPDNELPVDFVTNGVHVPGWVSPEMGILLDRYLGPRWREDPSDVSVWERVDRIPDEELWRAHERQRETLVSYARSTLDSQLTVRNASLREKRAMGEALRPDVLTIGFARRFATYKRADLILFDPPRLRAILTDPERPVQLVFAGKAHPRDDAGKELIRKIVRFSRQENLQDKIIFLEDYDLERARFMVRGCDVWLNTPRRPMEASGTSGMKVLVNGGLNLSILDGWWAEGSRPGVGWAIGTGEEYTDSEYQDRVESQALYSLLEQDVVPVFYDRGGDGLPRRWIGAMKMSMRTLVPLFSTARMIKDYVSRFYFPAAERYGRLAADEFSLAKSIAAWKSKVRHGWNEVSVVSVRHPDDVQCTVGSEVPLQVTVRLGSLSSEDVRVEAYFGRLNPDGAIQEGRGVPLDWSGTEDGLQVYRGAVPCRSSGMHGYAVRVLPAHEDVLIPNELALVTWE